MSSESKGPTRAGSERRGAQQGRARRIAIRRPRRFRRRRARLHRDPARRDHPDGERPSGLEPEAVRIHRRRACARQRQPEPVAHRPAQPPPRPVRGARGRLPDPRARHRQHDDRRRQDRRHRHRHADLRGGFARSDRPLSRPPRRQAGEGGHLHAYARRPFRRREGGDRRGRRQVRQDSRSSRRICSWSMRFRKT